MPSFLKNVRSGETTTGNNSDPATSRPSSASTIGTEPTPRSSQHIVSPYDKKDDGDACFEEVQQGFVGGIHNSTNRNATPKTLFSSASDANNNNRNHLHDRNNSDSNSSTEDLHSRRVVMMMESPALPPRNNSSREKQRRRTRSSSRRSNSNSSLSQSLLSDDYEKSCNNNIQSPLAVRRRSSKQSGSVSSSKRRSSSQNIKRPTVQSFDGYSIEKREQPHHYGAAEYSYPELSSESSPDSSPSRLVADMYRLQHQQHISSQEQHPSSSRLSLSSKSTMTCGSDSPTGSTGSYIPSFSTRSPKSSTSNSTSSTKLNNTKAKATTSIKSWCLAGTFVCMVMLSLSGIVLLTNRVVPAIEEDEQFVPALHNRPDNTGLRGKMVLGRMWDSSATNSENNSGSKKETVKGKEKKIKKKKSTDKHPNSVSGNRGVTINSQSKTKKTSKGGAELPHRLQMHMPPSMSKLEPKFDKVDPNLYYTPSISQNGAKSDSPSTSTTPRIVMLDPLVTRVTRKIKTYPADFTDNTQLYGILPSDDERLSKMEMRSPYSENECVPMQEWQTTFHPSCNGMHELALQTIGASIDHNEDNSLKKFRTGELEGLSANLFGTGGFWRYAWKVVLSHNDNRRAEKDTVVLKNLKYEHNFEDAHFEHDRIDAVAMERLTSSPHVINIFGFCGHSVMTEYADGKRLGELADKSKKKPLKRLEIARDIATGLADVHGIDGDSNTTFVHLDINPANVVSVNNTLKLNDFNIGIIRQWNTTSNEECGFPAQYPNPQWRSPEEARKEQHLTEKVDIFSLGHIFFRLICGHEPWNKLEPGGRPTKEEVNEKVQRGDLPFIPDHVRDSSDPEIIAILDVMLKCYSFDPTQRPSARDIANTFDGTIRDLTQKYLSKASDTRKEKKKSTIPAVSTK